MLTLPRWTSIRSKGTVSLAFLLLFSNVRSPWGGRHRSPGGQCYLLTVHSHTKQKQAPSHHCSHPSVFVLLSLLSFQQKGSTREVCKLHLQVQVARIILFWPEIRKKDTHTKPLNPDCSFNFIPQAAELGQPWRCTLKRDDPGLQAVTGVEEGCQYLINFDIRFPFPRQHYYVNNTF